MDSVAAWMLAQTANILFIDEWSATIDESLLMVFAFKHRLEGTSVAQNVCLCVSGALSRGIDEHAHSRLNAIGRKQLTDVGAPMRHTHTLKKL